MKTVLFVLMFAAVAFVGCQKKEEMATPPAATQAQPPAPDQNAPAAQQGNQAPAAPAAQTPAGK